MEGGWWSVAVQRGGESAVGGGGRCCWRDDDWVWKGMAIFSLLPSLLSLFRTLPSLGLVSVFGIRAMRKLQGLDCA